MRADTVARPRERPPAAARRFGYSVGLTVNLLLLYAVNGIGWERLSFLTAEASSVIVLLNVSLIAAVVANAVYAVHDPPGLKALGDAVTTAFSVVVLVRTWQVFPFSFDTSSHWELVVRTVLLLSVAGCLIAIAVSLVTYAHSRDRD